MSLPDQCPSTKGKQAIDRGPRELQRHNGQAYWRSVEEFSQAPEFQEFVQREFPAGASELLGSSRRDFLKLMGASVALAGAATIPGCRRPEHKIMPFSKDVPEAIIPGEALYYATSMALPGGGAEGLLIETHEGRPTKVEGNPLHPHNQGKSSIWAQASVLELYDPDRLVQPVYRGNGEERYATWDDFKVWGDDHFGKFDDSRGAGLAFLVGKKSSPSRDRMRDAIKHRWPEAKWIPYQPVENESAVAGSRLAFGAAHREALRLDKASVILSLDRDFLDHAEADFLPSSRDFASTRRVLKAHDEMSRLYVVEPAYTITGGSADHRLRLAPSRIGAFAVALAQEILPKRAISAPGAQALADAVRRASDVSLSEAERSFLDAAVSDLLANTNRGKTLIVAGASQPAEVHALAHALNAAMGAVGSTVEYGPMDAELAASSASGLASLADEIDHEHVDTLVCVDVNPVYDASGVDFASKFDKVPHTITLSSGQTETSVASEWQLNMAHWLESWGDTRTLDGQVAPSQPMIAPIYEPSHSDIEFLALLAGEETHSGHEIVRETWRASTGRWFPNASVDFERLWRRALHDGVVSGMRTPSAQRPAPRYGEIATALSRLDVDSIPSIDSMDVVFTTANVHDGRFANCGWLQELPHTATRVVWDNPLLLSPKTAEKLGLIPSAKAINSMYNKERIPTARMAMVKIDGRELALPVWVMPGLAENTAVVTLGYGRTHCGRVGGLQSMDYKVGFNTYQLRGSASQRMARGASLDRISATYTIASTQNHWSMESRDSIVRQLDQQWWEEHASKPDNGAVEKHGHYGTESTLNLAEQLGEMSHNPPIKSIYRNPYNKSTDEPSTEATYAKPPQWGMTIDQNTCTGCGVCTIACQSENNIPIVGKKEVAKGREMTWIRVDRYYTGSDLDDPDEMLHQPMACVHCENAPCETVCPVNATVHGPEGINYMVYNRCIGTRYCANNCPYKVRRFNFFDYGVKAFNGDFIGEEIGRPDNVNLIPPRLREKLHEIEKLQKNPDVTVRSRGVMEKCTYCIQRINQARHEVKLQGLDGVPDGFFQTACQQACPTSAITFGDILDVDEEYESSHGERGHASEVRRLRDNPRSYMLLGYLSTRPRTSHLLRIRNPNRGLLRAQWQAKLDAGLISEYEFDARMSDPVHAHGGGDGHGGEGGHGESGHGGEGDGHSFLIHPHKRREDDGYALSLRVLGAATGVQA